MIDCEGYSIPDTRFLIFDLSVLTLGSYICSGFGKLQVSVNHCNSHILLVYKSIKLLIQ